MFLTIDLHLKFRAFFITFGEVRETFSLDLVNDLLVKFARNERDALKISQVANELILPLIAPKLNNVVKAFSWRGCSLTVRLNS